MTKLIDIAGRSEFTREQYEAVLAQQFIPSSIVATRPDGSGGDWCRDSNRDLRHNSWLVQTEDPSKIRDSGCILPFDTVIDRDGLSLCDDSVLCDSLTKKKMCLRALVYGSTGRIGFSARGVGGLAIYFDWYLRWRWSAGLARTSHITTNHFEHFVSCLDGSDLLNLIPLGTRVMWLGEQVQQGLYGVPTRKFGRHLVLHWELLARKLGVTRQALARSREFRRLVGEHIPSWADLIPLDAGPEGPTVTDAESRNAGSVENIIAPWEHLVRLTAAGMIDHDPLGFSPFRTRSAGKIAADLGREGKRTETLLPEDFFRVLGAAATWVLEFSDHIIGAVTLMRSPQLNSADANERPRARRELETGYAAKAPLGLPPIRLNWRVPRDPGAFGGPVLPGQLTVADAAKYLMAACCIIIGGFAARRGGEVTSLQSGCIDESEPGLRMLSIYIEKTLRDVDAIPVPAIVGKAVDVLERLTADTRQATGEDWLFVLNRSLVSSKHDGVLFREDKIFDEFLDVCRLAPPNGKQSWSLRTHQLRRGFAISYYHGFQFANLDSLSRMLRHFDPEKTRIYVNEIIAGNMGRLREEIDARRKSAIAAMSQEDRNWITEAKKTLVDLQERSAIFNEVRCEALVTRMLCMWDGTEAPIGRGAAKLRGDLNAMVTQAAATVRLGPRSNDPGALRISLTRLAKSYAENHYLEPVPGHAAHCICRPGNAEDLADAECLKLKAAHREPWAPQPVACNADVQPDYAFSNAYICLICRHCAAFSENQKVISGTLEQYEDAAARAGTESAMETAARKLASFMAVAEAAGVVVRRNV